MLSVVGNRPQFIKSGPVSEALREAGIEEVVLHTGQHYDPELSQVFFDELGLGEPRYRLEVGGLGREEMLAALRPGLLDAIAHRAAGLGARLRRHELDARRRAGGCRGRRPARPRRGGPAQLRPLDAGGAQPDRDRPAVAAPLRPGRALARNARGRGRPRTGRGDGRRDGGRLLPARPARPRAIVDSGAARSRAAGVRRRHPPPRGERGAAAPGADPRGSRPNRGAARVPRAPHGPASALATQRSP